MPDTLIAPALPAPFTPSIPPPPERELPLLDLVRAFRTNALRIWPRRAYEEPVIESWFLGRHSVLVNATELVRHVLVEARDRYGGRDRKRTGRKMRYANIANDVLWL